jgi:hypothetical protein
LAFQVQAAANAKRARVREGGVHKKTSMQDFLDSTLLAKKKTVA